MTVQIRQEVEDSSQIGEARRAALRLAQVNGFDPTSAGRVGIAASELATNLVRHGNGGELLMQPIVLQNVTVIELLALDRGPGMVDTQRCLGDGYSTGGTPGNGLGAVRRLSSEFDVYSVRGEGTAVMARVGRRADDPPLRPRFGAVSVPLMGQDCCGDRWRLALDDGRVAMLLIDGLGHGPDAAQAAEAGAASFRGAPFGEPAEVLEKAHQSMCGTRGGAGACARVDRDGVAFAGIGNITGSLVVGGKAKGMPSHNGTLGGPKRRLQQFQYRHTAGSLLVMHSDGLSARWNLEDRADLLDRHPSLVAAILYRDHARRRDDATVVVLAT